MLLVYYFSPVTDGPTSDEVGITAAVDGITSNERAVAPSLKPTDLAV